MHPVHRSPEPGFFTDLRAANTQWDDLDGPCRHRIREALSQDFGMICAYCERLCQSAARNSPDAETIDHFRPRKWFSGLAFDWFNLVYACRRCNITKGSKWPGYGSAITEALLPALEYVNPNAADDRRPASDFFSFDLSNGEIAPSDKIGSEDWSIARRTISDIDLNDSCLGDNAPGNLRNLRRYQLYLMLEALMSVSGDPNSTNQIISESLSHHSPFSAYIAAYVNSPLFAP